MQNDIQTLEKEIARLKEMAEKHPILEFEKTENPPARHWSDLPGDIRICYTKEWSQGSFYYHLSISTPDGRIVEDVMAIIIMKMLNAPKDVYEEKDPYNECIRHFEWSAETKQQH